MYCHFLFCSCGYLDTSAVCGAHLQDKKVYFHDSKKQHQHERIIHNALSRSNLSTACYKLATAALCYHMFPSCNRRGAMKHRLCREDCLRVRSKVCKNQLPDIFPVCTDLPKSKSRKGRRCDKLDNGGKLLIFIQLKRVDNETGHIIWERKILYGKL